MLHISRGAESRKSRLGLHGSVVNQHQETSQCHPATSTNESSEMHLGTPWGRI